MNQGIKLHNNKIPSHAHILLTDDDPRMLDSLRLLLELSNYKIDTASGGQSAIDKLSNNQYDLVLLDLKMPVVTGHDVMQFMSENNINTLTIVVSGETSMHDIGNALKHGAYDYIKKPYIPEELTATVNNAIRKKNLEDSHHIMQERLNRSERLHRFIVNNSPDIIFMLDRNGNFSFLNSKIESILQYPKNHLIGRHISTIVDGEDIEKANYYFEHIGSSHVGAQSIELLLKSYGTDYKKHHFEVSLWPIDESDGKDTINVSHRYEIYGSARDISDRLEAEAFINFQAYHDLLTKLPNRELFKDRMGVAIAHAQRNELRLAVMFINLDRFKIINDSLGHTIGDKLLQSVSQRLQECIRNVDTLSRFGGDEFTLLLPEMEDTQPAVLIAENILLNMKEPFQVGEHEVHIGASIGIAIYPDSGENLDTLIKHADIAMYHAKKTGKDGYQVFDPQMSNSSTERLSLEQDMRRAIENNEFEVCYQPQVSTASGEIFGVEALIRWDHPRLGRLSPSDFIPIAEESHLIVDIDKQTLRKACREILHYHKNGYPGLRLAVNLSPVMIEKDNFVDHILKTLEEEQYPANLLELEITENILMLDRQDIADKLMRLAGAGIHLAIDDFGTGYSSLSYLQDFPINTLKIDRSFISTIRNTGDDSCIVDAIIAMAKGLKMTVVAEGVENKEQLDYLKALDCDIVQGFLFGKAMQLDHLTEKFKSDSKSYEEIAIL
ncbi:MAG: diguanylate cyclase (GGDEF)-like protein/PAS domain S-box-containing protein [Oceanicoccus sp.]|jgi:diguanylate cyclase (GGDEF)-like protein/PAS domain S-box-containing protein